MFNGLYYTLLYYFGTNLLTGGPAQVAVFCLFQCFAEKEYQTASKWNETFGSVLLRTNVIQETWSIRQGSNEEATRQGGAPYPLGAPPPSWGPWGSPPVDFCSSIFYIFQKNSPLIFSAFRGLLFLHKNNTMVVLLKTVSVRVSSNQIIPKSYKTIVNMA